MKTKKESLKGVKALNAAIRSVWLKPKKRGFITTQAAILTVLPPKTKGNYENRKAR